MIDPDPYTATNTIQTDKFNRTKRWTENIIDSHASLIFKRSDEYSYYPTGEIDTILLNRYSINELISVKSIKHFTDDRQPQSTINSLEDP